MAQTLPSPATTPPTADDWEARRLRITQLYLEENKGLKEVMALMNVGGFRASMKMYRSRITRWGIDRKNKEHEARAIIQLHAQRIGKPTRMTLRGRAVNVSKVEGYLKRKGISIEDVLSASAPPPSDLDLICRTPSPVASPSTDRFVTSSNGPSFHNTSPEDAASCGAHVDATGRIPVRIEAPDGLKIVEDMFADIREYVMGTVGFDELHLGMRSRIGSGAIRARFYCRALVQPLDKGMIPMRRYMADACATLVRGVPWLNLWGLLDSSDCRWALPFVVRTYCTPLILRVGVTITLMTISTFRRVLCRFYMLMKMDEPLNLISQSLMRAVTDIFARASVSQDKEWVDFVLRCLQDTEVTSRLDKAALKMVVEELEAELIQLSLK